MKVLAIAAAVFWASAPLASQGEGAGLLHCLGREELRIHRVRLAGPLVRLNRTLVNLLVARGVPPLSAGQVEKICSASDPSVALLREILAQPSAPASLRAILFPVFLDYLSHLQLSRPQGRLSGGANSRFVRPLCPPPPPRRGRGLPTVVARAGPHPLPVRPTGGFGGYFCPLPGDGRREILIFQLPSINCRTLEKTSSRLAGPR